MNYDDTSKFARLQSPQWEQSDRKPLGRSNAGKKKSATRPVVRIISHRCRLLDKDNLYRGCKALLDGLRYSCLLHSDSPEEIDYHAEQIKVPHRAGERTEIVIDY